MTDKIMLALAIWFWEKVFGEDFFDDFPEAQKKLAEEMDKILSR